MLAAAALTLAIVAQDQSALRAAPLDSASTQAVLWQGEVLEVRGQKGEFLQVYDHRLERAGYIRSWQVRGISNAPADAQALLSVVRFLHDQPGSEALGIAYSAAYLNAAPAQVIDGEAFDALGTFADRLARLASSRQTRSSDAAIAGHLDVAAGYGVKFTSFDNDGRVQLCYDGEAFRRVLALPASDEAKARAALALTRSECIDPAMTPTARAALDQWRVDVLNRVSLTNLAPFLKNRMHLARAGVYSSLTFEAARRGEATQILAQTAIDEFAAVVPSELPEPDAGLFSDAAIRVSAVRFAALAPLPAGKSAPRVAVSTEPGEPGQTCVALTDAKHDAAHPLIRRCTYGLVWPASARLNTPGNALTLAVEPTDGWRELWVFRKNGDDWTLDTLPPAIDGVQLGYLEFAGWVPGSTQLLAVREARVDGRYRRSFEVIDMNTLEVKLRADFPNSINAFARWQDPLWKHQTLSLRDIR